MLHSNIRGFASKQTSLQDIVDRELPDIVTLNETNMKNTRKINLKKYVSFCKNSEKNSHGISTSFAGYLKDNSVKVSQDQGGVDEFIVTRLENVEPALNIINFYGAIEERESKEDILESWTQIKKELNIIKERGEAVILIGDLNRAVGSGSSGVEGNKNKISFGGNLVRELIDNNDYFIMNNMSLAKGGPWTRQDPSYGTWSCLDFAIGSDNLKESVVGVVVDKEKMFTPFRVLSSKGVLTRRHTDHLSLMVEIKMKNKRMIKKPEVKWNTSKPEGWIDYMWISNLHADKIKKACEEEECIDKVEKKISNIDDKIRYSAFGKTKIKNKKTKKEPSPNQTEEDANKETLSKESKKIEEQVEALKKSKLGRVGQIMKMRSIISGPRRKSQEAIALKDSRSGELVVTAIRKRGGAHQTSNHLPKHHI